MLTILLQVGLATSASGQYGGYGRPWYSIHPDKIQYQAGDIVTIKIEGGVAGQPSNELALVKIFGLGSNPTERNIVYEETKRLQNGWAEFNYEIPLPSASSAQSQDSSYRYLVQVFGANTVDDNGGSTNNDNSSTKDQAIFFTKEEASKIVISGLEIANDNTTSETIEGAQDDNTTTISKGSLVLEFRVTDGLGKPIPDPFVGSAFYYQSCHNGRNGLGSDLFMDDYYNNNGLVRAKIPLLDDVEPGIYNSLFIDAQSGIGRGYREVRDIVTVELSNGSENDHNNGALKGRLIGVQTVGSGDFSPPKWPSKTTAIYINGNNNALTVTSDNRICDYEYTADKNMLSLHVASTELPQFMEIAIPSNLSIGVDASSIYADINGYKPLSEMSVHEKNYVLSFNYTGCVLDLYTSCNIHIHGIKTLAGSNSSVDEGPGNSAIPCTYDFTADMHQRIASTLDNDKAISLATSNTGFQSKVHGYRATFNSIFVGWKGGKESCTNTLETVNVVYSLYDGGNGYVKNVVVTLDPELTYVINITEHKGGSYGGSQSGSEGGDKQLQECQELGISSDKCNDIAILQARQLQSEDRKIAADQQNQINNSMYMIGIGAAIAGVFAFITLRKKN